MIRTTLNRPTLNSPQREGCQRTAVTKHQHDPATWTSHFESRLEVEKEEEEEGTQEDEEEWDDTAGGGQKSIFVPISFAFVWPDLCLYYTAWHGHSLAFPCSSSAPGNNICHSLRLWDLLRVSSDQTCLRPGPTTEDHAWHRSAFVVPGGSLVFFFLSFFQFNLIIRVANTQFHRWTKWVVSIQLTA